jgi:hypothetical protein
LLDRANAEFGGRVAAYFVFRKPQPDFDGKGRLGEAQLGLPRPIEFTTTKGDGRTLVVLKRSAPQWGYKADRSTITAERIAPESRVP